VIDLSVGDDRLLAARAYHAITNPDDRLFVPPEYVPLFRKQGLADADGLDPVAGGSHARSPEGAMNHIAPWMMIFSYRRTGRDGMAGDKDKQDDSFFEDLAPEDDPWRGMGFVHLGPMFPDADERRAEGKASDQTTAPPEEE
jgi:hypothetical protein